MRIGLLTGSLSREGGGVFSAMQGLSIALRSRGADVRVFGLADNALNDDRASWGDIPVHVAQIWGPRAFGYAHDLYHAIISSQLDVLHVLCPWMYPSVVCLRWARATRHPVIVSGNGSFDPWALANARWKKRIADSLYERRHLRRAACVHALCEAEALAMRHYGLDNPVCIIPNGVDLPEAAPSGEIKTPWRNSLPTDAKVLLFLGRLHPKKNVIALIDVWRDLQRTSAECANWWLVIAGNDQIDYEAECKRHVSEMGASRVLFVGPQYTSAKDASFRNASAFVLPSLSEGLPMAVLEAWSYGLPVLMTPECNLPEGIKAGAAIQCTYDKDGIERGLLALFSMSDAERHHMGKAARRLVEQRYTWPGVAHDMASVYEWALCGGAPPSCVRRTAGRHHDLEWFARQGIARADPIKIDVEGFEPWESNTGSGKGGRRG
jgi:poly(glycerol-phosphate) alpha-glucosyltransferase